MGILIPQSFTESVGITESAYHVIAVSAGAVAGVLIILGLFILVFRRTTNSRVSATTTNRDRLVLLALLVTIATGVIATIGEGLIGGGYDYCETVSPWFRKLLVLDPDPALMSGIPFIFQLHVISAFILFAIWPFTRLVHAWSIPFTYMGRSPIIYRSRIPSTKGQKAASVRR